MGERTVKLDCYEGPLDLLVQLVRLREVDVLEVAVAQIAAAYVQAIEVVDTDEIEAVGDFLVLLTMLMELKSKSLIPTHEEEAEVEEPTTRQELVRQLIEYKRFKEVAGILWQRAQLQRQKLERSVDDVPADPKDPGSQPITELELWDLVSAFSRLMKENIVPTTDSIPRDPTPIGVYMDRLVKKVMETGGLSFRALLGTNNTKPQLIGKFLALLELVKSHMVWVEIDPVADEITIEPPRAETQLLVESSVPMPDTEPPPDVQVATDSSPSPEAQPESADSANADQSSSGEERSSAWEQENADTSKTSAWDDFESILDEDNAAEGESPPV